MIASELTPHGFKAWRLKMGLSHKMCAKRLGISVSSVFAYEAGTRKEGDVKIPILVCLGMSAVSAGLIAYGEEP